MPSEKNANSFSINDQFCKKNENLFFKNLIFSSLRRLKQFDTVFWKKKNIQRKQRWDDSTNKDKTYKAIICKYSVSSHSWGDKRIIFRETTSKSAQ